MTVASETPRQDACPECRGRVLCDPAKIVEIRESGYTADYVCHRCGHAWRTAWAHEWW